MVLLQLQLCSFQLNCNFVGRFSKYHIEEKRELEAEARRQEALRLEREELAVRTDKAVTKREVVRGSLLLQERMR